MRDLYELFRDGVIEDAILLGGLKNKSVWAYVSQDWLTKGDKTVGRMQTMALIRRFMQRASKEFPGGITLVHAGFSVDPTFVDFVKTHREMGSSLEDMVKAWSAIRSIE